MDWTPPAGSDEFLEAALAEKAARREQEEAMKDEQRQRKATERELLESAIERVAEDGGLERLRQAIEQTTGPMEAIAVNMGIF